MTVLLTGATGFLGSQLLRALAGAGHDVVVLKRSISDTARIADILPRVASVDVDRTSIADIFAGHPAADTVVHAATSYGRGETLASLARANILWPLELLEGLKAHAAHHSAAAAFINTDTCFTKARGYRYLQGYTTSKKQFVELARIALEGSRVHLVNMKLEHVYGPHDGSAKFMTSIIRQCLANTPSIDLTPGTQERDFIYVEDVSAAYVRVLRRLRGETVKPAFTEYEVGTGVSHSIRHVVTRIAAISGAATQLRFGALAFREGEIMHSVADTAALRGINFTPRFTLDEGLAATIESERIQSLALAAGTAL